MKTPQAAVTWSALLCTPASHWERTASTLGTKVRYGDRFLVVLPITPVNGSRVGIPYGKTNCLLRYPLQFVIQHHPEFDAS
jgi:hypothetical protein